MHMTGDPRRATTALQRLHDAYNRRDPASAARLYASDGLHETVPQARVARGPTAVRAGLERFFAAFPDAHWDTEAITGSGDDASVAYRLTATLTGPLDPLPAAGQRLDLRGVHVVQTDRRGRIRRSTDYWDAATFARQMRVGGDDVRTAAPAPRRPPDPRTPSASATRCACWREASSSSPRSSRSDRGA